MTTYKCLRADNSKHDIDDLENISCQWTEASIPEVSDKHILIRVSYSSMNYKDALALTGKGKILRKLPLTPGIDASGVISKSRSDTFKEGDEVFVTGCGLGEHINGGYGEYILVPEESVITKPNNLSLKDGMILGTAGFTAGLALHQLEKNDLAPDKGKVLVTGATGGVGSLSLLLLNKKGYETEAWTRKEESVAWLKECGASEVTVIANKDWKTRPLESGTWAAAIDNVGDEILSYIYARIQPHGGIACIGLAKSPKLHTTVFPLILRGVNLLGISSGTCLRPLREKIWEFLNEINCDWPQALSKELSPDELLSYADEMIAGKTLGRAIVKMN